MPQKKEMTNQRDEKQTRVNGMSNVVKCITPQSRGLEKLFFRKLNDLSSKPSESQAAVKIYGGR